MKGDFDMDLRNEKLTVIEIQQNLLELYESGVDLPYVIPDGIYGEETRAAVLTFQRLYSLPTSGRVDDITWQALSGAAERAYASRSEASGIFPFSERLASGMVTVGERSDLVAIIQIMLGRLSGYDYEKAKIDGIYGGETARLVKGFQELNALPQSGNVDKATWNALALAYNNAVRGDPNI